MVIAHPGSMPGWDFAGSFELRNAADGGISGVGSIAILGARPAHALLRVNPLAICTVRWSPNDPMLIVTTYGNLLSTPCFCRLLPHSTCNFCGAL
jgi:hypothetical protein